MGLDRKWPWDQMGSGRRVGQDEGWGWTGGGLGVRQEVAVCLDRKLAKVRKFVEVGQEEAWG